MRSLLVSAFWFVLVSPAGAQVSYGEKAVASNAAGITLVAMDFRFDGTAPSEIEFAFDGLAYGVYYNRHPLMLTYVRGAQTIGSKDKLALTDFSMSGWIPFRPFTGKKDSKVDFFFPIGLQSDYRRIQRTQGSVEVDAFEYTVVAAGTGVGASAPVFRGILSAKGLAYYGIATRSFGFDTDTSAIMEIDVDWISALLTDKFGISLGYSYRWQKWYSDLGQLTGDSFDFIGKHHAFRLGMSF